MVALIVVWIIFSLLVALLGSSRRIGFTKSLVAAIILTPVIGIVIALLSKSKKEIARKEDLARLSKEYLDMIARKK